MHSAYVENYEMWREKARDFLHTDISPDEIIWLDSQEPQQQLFASTNDKQPILIINKKILVPKDFFNLAEIVACHRHTDKWQKLYQLLWRLTHGEKHLLAISSDPLVNEILLLAKAVRRDSHKMKAFVRFRCYETNKNKIYVAWYQPDHKILRRVAPFFVRRFGVMDWIIITPDETAAWNAEQLHFLPGNKDFRHLREDALDDLWLTYYRAIFNPARIKIKAMRREMPVRYWHNLPETKIINDMLTEAPKRVTQMLSYSEGIASSARDYFPNDINLINLKNAAESCRACPIHECAKQSVFGEGADSAEILFIGEQPGQIETKIASPFSGLLGEYLKKTLKNLDIDTQQIYFTYAVKHFKHKVIDNEIISQNPTIREINACKSWLFAEIDLVKPKIIVCLGLIAARSLISSGFHFKDQRGKWQNHKNIPVLVTYNPTTFLSMIDDNIKTQREKTFLQDMKKVTEKLI